MKKRLKSFLYNLLSVLKKPEMVILPGQLAYYFVLSIVPTITLLGYATSFLHISNDFVGEFLAKALSQDIANLVVNNVGGISLGIKFYFTLIMGYFIASNGAASIVVTSNAIYGIENKSFLYRRLKAFVMTIFLILLFIFMLAVPIFGEKIIEMIKFVNLNDNVTTKVISVFQWIKGPFYWFVMFIIIKQVYTMAPDRKVSSKDVNHGALFTTIMWILVTAIFSYYIANFASYDVFYGGLTNIVILMIWFYLLSYIFTIGMALNRKAEIIKLEKTGQIKIVE